MGTNLIPKKNRVACWIAFSVLSLLLLKGLLTIVFVRVGNSFYPNHLSESRIFYLLSWPYIYQAEVPHFNIGQTYYFENNYKAAEKEYVLALSNIGKNDKKRCPLLIQLVNARLRPLEQEFDKGNISNYKDDVNTAIDTLTECLEIDIDNKAAAGNIAILITARDNTQPQKASKNEQSSSGDDTREKEVQQTDLEAQRNQKEFNDNDSTPKDYDTPNW